jgi:hypothetical protein
MNGPRDGWPETIIPGLTYRVQTSFPRSLKDPNDPASQQSGNDARVAQRAWFSVAFSQARYSGNL